MHLVRVAKKKKTKTKNTQEKNKPTQRGKIRQFWSSLKPLTLTREPQHHSPACRLIPGSLWSDTSPQPQSWPAPWYMVSSQLCAVLLH